MHESIAYFVPPVLGKSVLLSFLLLGSTGFVEDRVEMLLAELSRFTFHLSKLFLGSVEVG